MFVISQNPGVTAFAGGINGTAAKNTVYRITFGGAWSVGDGFSFNIITNANTFTCGTGYISGVVPVDVITLYKKVNFVSGTTWYFSDNNNPTGTEQQHPGAGFINLSNQFATPENLVSLTQYQGMICVQSRRTSQIWVINPYPANYSLFQTLANIGSLAPLGANSIGDLDVIFPYDSGVRSLQARDVTLNASTADTGSAIDIYVQAQLQTLSQAQLSQLCSINEPNQSRYWIFVPNANGVGGVIYVLSYFRANKIVAWSRYNTTFYQAGVSIVPAGTLHLFMFVGLSVGSIYLWTPGTLATTLETGTQVISTQQFFKCTSTSGVVISSGGYDGTLQLISNGQSTFVPQKFVVWQGQVYISDSGSIFQWGGSSNNLFDATPATMQLPFYDEKRAMHQKVECHIDADVENSWTMYGSTDWINSTFVQIGQLTGPTFDQGNVPYQDFGTHTTFKFTSVGVGYAEVNSVMLNYELGENPPS